MAKWIIGIIIVALLGGALWYSGVLNNLMGSSQQTAVAPVTPAPVATTTPQVPQPENGMAATNDASDAALTQDTTAVDAQITGLNTDNSSVDSSMSDQQTVQSY